MARYGYARISSTDQDCSLQEARLRAEGCKVVRTEKASGKSRDRRDELARIMDFLHAADELVVVKLDRLGRSTRDVLNLVHDFEAKGAALTVDMLGVFAEFETNLRRERQLGRASPRPRRRASTRAEAVRPGREGPRDARCRAGSRRPSPRLLASAG